MQMNIQLQTLEFYYKERKDGTHRIGRWTGPTASPNVVVKRKSVPLVKTKPQPTCNHFS
jgi:hypothetical protein